MFRTAFALTLLISIFTSVTARAQGASIAHPPVLDVTSIDTSVDPCTDFFTYACGGWLKKNPIPPDKSSWSASAKLSDDNQVLLREILEEAAAGGPERDPVKRKIGDYYAACMDEKAVEAAGAGPLKAGLQLIDRMRSKSDLARVAAGMLGQHVLFDFQSDQDFKNSSQVIAEVDQSGLGLPDRDYYLKTDLKSVQLRHAYAAHVRKMFELLGDAPDLAATEAHTVLRIETALANGFADPGGTSRAQIALPQNDAPGTGGAQSVLPLEGILFPGRPARAALPECDRAGILQSHGRNRKEGRPGKLEGLLALAPGACQRVLPLLGICERRLRFLRQDPGRGPATRARAGSAV